MPLSSNPWLKQYVPTMILIALGIFLRFYHLESRTNLTGDGGRDYAVVRHMVLDKKPTLLGPKVSVGEFFFGPLYYYLLAPSLIIGNFDPLSGAVMTAGLDSLALVLFAVLSRRILHDPGALLVTSLYATFPLLISMVKVPLNPFVIPFFSVLFLFFLSLSTIHYPLITSFGPGLVAGLLFQLHFATAPMVILGLICLSLHKKRLQKIIGYLCGVIIGVSPMIAFDLRHQFFNSNGMLKFLFHPQGGHIDAHYLIVFFPLLFLAIGLLLNRLPKQFAYGITGIILIINTLKIIQPTTHGYLMPDGWNLPGIRKAVALVAGNNPPEKFAIAATLDGDTRAMPYRYLLEAKYSKIPLGVEKYPEAQTLYVVTRDSAEVIINNPVWEIASIQPSHVTKTWQLQNGVLLHKLEKL